MKNIFTTLIPDKNKNQARRWLALMIVGLMTTGLFAQQTMTFDVGASEPGFTFNGWSAGGGEIWMSDLNSPATISKDAGTWNLTSFEIVSFPGDNEMKIESDLGHIHHFSTSELKTVTLNWNGITTVTFTRTYGTSTSSGYDNFVYNTTTTSSAPSVSTSSVTNITNNSATGNGSIDDLGSPDPTAHGVCWNIGGSPTTADNSTNLGGTSSTGSFSASISGLTQNTTYYVRAYATNDAGTAYGNQVSFTTKNPGLWTGADPNNNNWNTPGNWDGGQVPTSSVDVTIPETGSDPVISAAATCQNITIQAKGALTINSSQTLDVTGDFTLDGDGNFTNSGTLKFSGDDCHLSDNRAGISSLGDVTVEETIN